MGVPDIEIVSLHIYPVKSCGAINLDHVYITERGLMAGSYNGVADRRWMLIDESADNLFITQRERPELARVKVDLSPRNSREVAVSGVQFSPVYLHPDQATGKSVTALMHAPQGGAVREKVQVHLMEGPGSEWFQEFLGNKNVRLVYQRDEDTRCIDRNFTPSLSDYLVGLNDGYQILMTSIATLEKLNNGLANSGYSGKPMDRFRPNIVIGGVKANQENTFRFFEVGPSPNAALAGFGIAAVLMAGVKPCTRCKITGTDQTTGIYEGPEVVKELSRTSAVNYKQGEAKVAGAVFGENVTPMSMGPIRTGNIITVLDAKPLPQFKAA